MAAINKTLWPHKGVISSDQPDAVQALQAKMDEAKAEQERMKRINKAHRAFVADPVYLETSDLSEVDRAVVVAHGDMRPFPAYATQNNLANIKRIAGRIAKLSRQQAIPTSERRFAGGRAGGGQCGRESIAAYF